MKNTLLICIGIILSGAIYSLCNAANNYGLSTLSLPAAILAQGDDTSGGDNTNEGKIECDGYNVLCGFYLDKTYDSHKVESNSEGCLEILGMKLYGYKQNTVYTVYVSKRSCKPAPNNSCYCIRAEEGVFKENVLEESSTNGDSTNGN